MISNTLHRKNRACRVDSNRFDSTVIAFKKSLMFSGIHMIQLPLIDKAMMLTDSIDLQSFIMIKNKKGLPRSQKEILKKQVFTKMLL
jgi:hypothetical protein